LGKITKNRKFNTLNYLSAYVENHHIQ